MALSLSAPCAFVVPTTAFLSSRKSGKSRISARAYVCRAAAAEDGIAFTDAISKDWPLEASLASLDDVQAHYREARSGVVHAAPAAEEGITMDDAISGEWAAHSLVSFDDVMEFYANKKGVRLQAAPGTLLSDIMTMDVVFATPDMHVSDAAAMMTGFSGMPVVKSQDDSTLLGVVSRKDLMKAGQHVKDVMSSPAVALGPSDAVTAAAVVMLKHKVHRLPIVDGHGRCVGIVTRTDVFTAMDPSL